MSNIERGIIMKRFLYYNQDSVNSFLAQIEQGLLVKQSDGSEKTNSHSSTNAINSNLSGDLNAKALGIGASLKGTIQGDNADTEAVTTLIRNIQEKVLHDYAFECVYNYVIDNMLVNNNNPQIGDIVLITETPTFLDFNYFKLLFSESGAVKMYNEQNKKLLDKNVDKLKNSIPKGTQMPLSIKQQINDVKTTVNNAESERREMIKTIDVIRNTIPYNRFIMTQNMLMPLDDDSFRDNPDIVAFKYGGNVSMFGYVTNIVSAGTSPSRNNDFAPLYDAINQIMLNMFKNQSKVYIVHPVALFY